MSSFTPTPPGSSADSIHHLLRKLLQKSSPTEPPTSPPTFVTPGSVNQTSPLPSKAGSSPSSSVDSDEMKSFLLRDISSASSSTGPSTIDTLSSSTTGAHHSIFISVAQFALGVAAALLFDKWWRRRGRSNSNSTAVSANRGESSGHAQESTQTDGASTQLEPGLDSIGSSNSEHAVQINTETTPLLNNASTKQSGFTDDEHLAAAGTPIGSSVDDPEKSVRSDIIPFTSPIKSDHSSPSNVLNIATTTPSLTASGSLDGSNGPAGNGDVSAIEKLNTSADQKQMNANGSEPSPVVIGASVFSNGKSDTTDLAKGDLSLAATSSNGSDGQVGDAETTSQVIKTESKLTTTINAPSAMEHQDSGTGVHAEENDVAVAQRQNQLEVAMEHDATMFAKEAGTSKGQVRVSQLIIYPIKGCSGISVESVCMTSLGLENDRRMVVIDFTGRALNQKKYPVFAQVAVSYLPNGDMQLQHRSKSELRAEFTPRDIGGDVRVVRHVNGAELEGIDQGEHAARFFSETMEIAGVRLIHLKRGCAHHGDVDGKDEYTSAFADEFPLLVGAQASVDQMNEWVGDEEVNVGFDRFRPNIMVDSAPKGSMSPFEEDEWDTITIGEKKVCVKLLTRCARCKVISVDQETGVQNPVVLRTLFKHRKEGSAAYFARNAAPINAPVLSRWNDRQKKDAFVISVGDVVDVTSK